MHMQCNTPFQLFCCMYASLPRWKLWFTLSCALIALSVQIGRIFDLNPKNKQCLPYLPCTVSYLWHLLSIAKCDVWNPSYFLVRATKSGTSRSSAKT